jgi:hypothetical protein
MAIFAMSNFAGPLLLGRFFDTVGRIPMISSTYLDLDLDLDRG